MKKILLFTLLILMSSVSFSQDIISLKNGTRREVIVTETTPTLVLYRFFNEPNGRTYFLYQDEIDSIEYQDGRPEPRSSSGGQKAESSQNQMNDRSYAQNVRNETVVGNFIPVRIEYTENGRIITNAVIYLLYYDSEKSELVEKIANTGNGNVVVFDVPLDKEGASYPFVVLYTKEEVNKAKDLIKTTTIRAYRTPPGEKCDFFEFSMVKGGSATTKGCAIQMWFIGKR